MEMSKSDTNSTDGDSLISRAAVVAQATAPSVPGSPWPSCPSGTAAG